MFNKTKCKKCKYRAKCNGEGVKVLACNYSSYHGTCLKRVGKEVIDLRGNDPDNCKLYEEGEPKKGNFRY